MITVTHDLDGNEIYAGAYGPQLLLDCSGCESQTFHRKNIEDFMEALCDTMDMDREDLYFWDDLDVPEEERQTEPHAKGTSGGGVFRKKIGIQFILTSSVVIHTLDVLGRCYIDVFSCKEFDESSVKILVYKHFKAKVIGTHSIIRN